MRVAQVWLRTMTTAVPGPELHRSYHQLRVARVIEETADAVSIVLDIPADLEGVFQYQSGQFLTFKIPYEDKVLVRCYSLSSAPGCDAEHQVTIKRIADGRISNWVNDTVCAGSTLMVLPPAGLFTLADSDRDLVFFSAGSGITPVFSLMKSALAASQRTVRLVYANRDEGSIIFKDEIECLSVAYRQRLSVVHRLDDVDGFMDVAAAREIVAAGRDAEFYMCGPGPFMDVVKQALTAEHIAEQCCHVECFESPPDEPYEEMHDRAVLEAQAAGDIPELITVNLDGSTQQVAYTAGETVLGAIRRAGVEPPFSCTDGYCGCCMAKLEDGEVKMANNDFLSDEDVAAGWILTCQSCPITASCEVTYPD